MASTSLSFLKPRLQRIFRPTAGALAQSGITANQVTLLGLLGSIVVGVVLLFGVKSPRLFVLLPVWLIARMVFNTVDGLLANEYGQKSRIGAVLDEVGDIVSDIALCFTLVLASPFSPHRFAFIILLGIVSECAEMAGRWFGAGRRHEGPFGKTDRALLFGALADIALLMPVLVVLHLVIIANRIRFVVANATASSDR